MPSLSAQTATASTTPEPHGKPGGPGLYRKKGNKHSDYFEHIVGALMKQGKSQAEASAIAWSALRRWRAGRQSGGGKGKITAKVRAAAGRALQQERSAGATHTLTRQYDFVVIRGGGMWQGLGRGRGWKYLGPVQQRPAAGSQQQRQTADNLGSLEKSLGEVKLEIKAAKTAVQADITARNSAQVALAAAVQFAKGGFTTTGGSTASGSSTGTVTTPTGTTGGGTTTTTAASGSTYQSVTQAQNTLNTINAKLARDTATLNGLITKRNGIQAQIKKLGG